MDVGFLLHDQALSVDKAELTTCASDDESVGEDELIMYPPLTTTWSLEYPTCQMDIQLMYDHLVNSLGSVLMSIFLS